MRRPLVAALAATAALAPAAPADALLRGPTVTCALTANVDVDPATGAYSFNAIGSPCEPLVFNDELHLEHADVTGTGTLSGDPCRTATSSGQLSVRMRWRESFDDMGYTATWAGGTMIIDGRKSLRRMYATLHLVPRDPSCTTGFFGAGRMTIDYAALEPLP